MNVTASAKKKSKSNGTSNGRASNQRYVLCIDNLGYKASLEKGKVYRVLPDRDGAKVNFIRVIDESGEDYLFPARGFVVVKLPAAARRALTSA